MFGCAKMKFPNYFLQTNAMQFLINVYFKNQNNNSTLKNLYNSSYKTILNFFKMSFFVFHIDLSLLVEVFEYINTKIFFFFG